MMRKIIRCDLPDAALLRMHRCEHSFSFELGLPTREPVALWQPL
jgi:hypothetical protein